MTRTREGLFQPFVVSCCEGFSAEFTPPNRCGILRWRLTPPVVRTMNQQHVATTEALVEELHQVEARTRRLIEERARLQHELNVPPPAAMPLSPQEQAAAAKLARATQAKEVHHLQQQCAHAKEALATRQRELDTLLADERAALAADVELGAKAYYTETRRLRQALHEQQQQQQPGSVAGTSRSISLRKLRDDETRVKAELESATAELTALSDQEAILEQRTLEVRRALVRAEQEHAVNDSRAVDAGQSTASAEPGYRKAKV